MFQKRLRSTTRQTASLNDQKNKRLSSRETHSFLAVEFSSIAIVGLQPILASTTKKVESSLAAGTWLQLKSEISKVIATERAASPFPVWSKPIYSSYQKEKKKPPPKKKNKKKENTKEKRDREHKADSARTKGESDFTLLSSTR